VLLRSWLSSSSACCCLMESTAIGREHLGQRNAPSVKGNRPGTRRQRRYPIRLRGPCFQASKAHSTRTMGSIRWCRR
jgi:hypothetical protein